ncbi:General substrate transporter [Mycena indigotica]|uniref:General substrate transporter n=1 Tax=Mycena indigotica TaxID=2126181 RepID=A0A8H6SEP9_9AGAR|nr:General substrate transporter [Mycena indigotica]KAF7297405.1 General substrate transporter [Mycena indigotica]
MPLAAAPTLIQDVLRWNVETRPQSPFYVFAEAESAAPERIVTITHLEFTRAAHRAARLLEGEDGQVVAVIAQSDTAVYHAVVAGLITANLIPFPISPRNSPAAIVNLLRKTSCRRLVSTCVTLAPLLRQINDELESEYGLVVEEMPLLSLIYPHLGHETEQHEFEEYPRPQKTPSLDDVCLYLHSSGSTGMPKAIPETHRGLMQWTRLGTGNDIREHIPHPIAAMPIPTFHMGGIFVQFLNPIYNGVAIALYPPTATTPDALPIFPSPNSVLEHSIRTKCRSMITIPALLSGLAHSPEAVEFLSTLGLVAYSGGSLPDSLGKNLVNAGVKLVNLYGGTEFGAVSYAIPLEGDEREWEYCRFVEGVNVRWEPQGDGTFECQFLHSDSHTVAIENLDDVRGYATNDLWMPHSEKKYLWRMVGRIDDVIVHSSGEKTVPAPIEDVVSGSPLVSGVVMFGWKRDEAGILIETIPSAQIDVHSEEAVTQLRHQLWPIIEQANQHAPAFSRIFKEMILFTSANKPLPRTGKRTVMRKLALKEYAEEIDALYRLVGEKAVSVKLPESWEVEKLKVWLTELVCELLKTEQISPELDLFHQGFDSLSATFLRIRIVAAIRSAKITKSTVDVHQNLIYTYPTISLLATFLSSLVFGRSKGDMTEPQEFIDAFIAKYAGNFPVPVTTSPTRRQDDTDVVLLTGSTGNLGSELLAALLQSERISRRSLDVGLLESPKLVFVDGATDREQLGLSDERYAELQSSVTLIIHNAWRLDFNLSIVSFEPHIIGTRRLVELALSSVQQPRIVFTSSIASAMSWNPSRGPCPEEFLSSDGVAVGTTGYGQSKLVTEQILARSGLSASCLRIGQVCGSLPTGAWAVSDWVPILVKTSVTLGCLPLAPGLVSWIDFDTIRDAILDVAFNHNSEATVFNAVHPRPVSWDFVITALRDALVEERNTTLELVDFADWFARLEVAALDASGESLPGLKLLDFFHYLSTAAATTTANPEFGSIAFKMDKLQAISQAVRLVEPISAEQVRAWVRYWAAAGLL